MRKITLLLAVALTLTLAGCALKLPAGNQNVDQTNQEVNTNQAGLANPASVNCEEKGGQLEIVTVADGSQSGVCKFSDGSECEEWAFFRGECQPDSAQDETSKAKEAIKQLFAQKYNKVLSEITVTISQQDENHARGSVLLGQEGAGEGGNYLAAKINDSWQLVFDGNGGISCDLVAPYNFPESMISDCYNQ